MVLIIAEAGVNHNGSLKVAKELVDAAIFCGADIIKFQLFKAKDLVVPNTQKANYQIDQNKNYETQQEMLERFELSAEEQKKLKHYCDKKNIEFLSSGFDLESLLSLQKLNLKRYKVPSGEITNLPYLRFVGSQNKPVILSTGMSNLDEINSALNCLRESGTNIKDITVLHCTTEYPAPLKDINLNAMHTIKNKFKVDVGYSDHSLGLEVSFAAVALGAKVIEKHITLDRNMEGPDHSASLEPSEFKDLVQGLKNISIALGSYQKKITDSEMKNINVVRKSIVAKKKIRKGDFFSNENLCTKRPGTGISPMKWDELIGKRSSGDYEINDLITF